MKLRIILLTLVITLFLSLNIINISGEYSLPNTVKIGLSYGESAVNNFNIKSPYGILILDSDGNIVVSENSPNGFTFSITGSYNIQICDPETGEIKHTINAEKDILIKPNEVNIDIKYLEYNNRKYRGAFILRRLSDKNITIVNDVNFEEYLYGVVPSESPSSWPMEALKAQAVAARNFAVLNISKHSKYGFDLCDTQDCQVYKGLSQETDATNQAVNQTENKLIYYNDKPINAFYHSSSGGHTENSENIFSSPLPYIIGVDDQFSLGNKNDSWIKSFDKEYIKNKMINSKLDVGDILDIIPIETSEFGRVIKVEIKGTKSSEILQKEKIRYVLGSTDLKSIWYSLRTDADICVLDSVKGTSEVKRVSGMYVASASGVKNVNAIDNIKISNGYRTDEYNKIPNNYIFYGRGFGHGLGMSQYGAKGMAEAGYDYKQILEYYYKGTKVR